MRFVAYHLPPFVLLDLKTEVKQVLKHQAFWSLFCVFYVYGNFGNMFILK